MSTTIRTSGHRIERAVRAFRTGKPVLIYDADDREGEVDIVYPAGAVKPRDVQRLRNDAGGLICVALSHAVCEAFDLPFLSEEIEHVTAESGRLAYGDRSSFSLPVNHRDTRTGITDEDRSLTIRELGDAALRPNTTDFASTFRSPGHVPILKGAPNLLSDRQGHTELGLTLARLSGRAPAVVVCEMLDDKTGDAVSTSKAMTYAKEQELPFLKGKTLCEYESRS